MLTRSFIILMALVCWNFNAYLAQAEEPENRSLIVGTTPYSNQWKFEELNSFLYLSFNSQSLAHTQWKIGDYTTSFGDVGANYPALDYFVRVLRGDAETASFWQNLGLWMRYSLGGGFKKGSLNSESFELSAPSATGYATFGSAQIGLNIAYERFSSLVPYLGSQFALLGYRHTASISGAESKGGSGAYEFVAGLHAPVLFEHRISFFAEGKWTRILNPTYPAAVSGATGTAGVGVSL